MVKYLRIIPGDAPWNYILLGVFFLMVFFLAFNNAAPLSAEEYDITLIERIDVAKYRQSINPTALYAKDYKSYMTISLLEGQEGRVHAKLYDSLKNKLWEGDLGLGIYLGPNKGFFVSANPFDESDTRIYNINTSSGPISTISFSPSAIDYSMNGDFVLLGGDEIVLFNSEGFLYFQYKLRMQMHSRISVGYQANYMAVGDLLWESDLNEHKYLKEIDTTTIIKDPHRVPPGLTRAERLAYVEEQKAKIDSMREERRKQRESMPSRAPYMGDPSLQQYITILTKSGSVISEIPIPMIARRIALSYPDCKYVTFANHSIFRVYSQSGDSICSYTDQHSGAYISSIAIADEGMVCAVVNESRYMDNTKRRLIVTDFNGNLLAEHPLLDLQALGQGTPELFIHENRITVNDGAEKSTFQIK